MSMEALNSLNSSVGSLVDESLFGEMETEELLLRRLSPYATLRSGDLSALLGIQHPPSDHSSRKLTSSLFDAPIVEERSESDSESDKEEAEIETKDIVVRGQDIGDLPAEYVVRGLRPHEMPVIGVYVDPRILPGFRYRIRQLGTDKYLFDGKALTLLSIGLGYGKRLTFSGDSLNFNDNYFWSDSHPDGFAFSLDAVKPDDELTIYGCNGTGIIGEVKVVRVPGVQKELSSEVVKGDVIKKVRVELECGVTYYQRQSGMVGLKLHDVERTSGIATVIKRRGSRVASLDCIHDVALKCIPGPCTLQVEV